MNPPRWDIYRSADWTVVRVLQVGAYMRDRRRRKQYLREAPYFVVRVPGSSEYANREAARRQAAGLHGAPDKWEMVRSTR